MICLLEGEINTDSVHKLVGAYNESYKLNTHLDIYLNTEGGDVGCMEAIIGLINTNRKTTLTAYEKVYSAGFFIFFRSLCEKYLLPGTVGMFHYIKTPISIDENKKAYSSEDKALQAWAKDQNIWTNQLCIKLGMTPLEFNKIKKGEEVYFQYSRLLEFLQNG